MRRVRWFFHCLSSQQFLLTSACPDHLIPRRARAAAGPTGRWSGKPGKVRWRGDGRSRVAACCTFSICHESGAAHYRGVLSTELTRKRQGESVRACVCARAHVFFLIHIVLIWPSHTCLTNKPPCFTCLC